MNSLEELKEKMASLEKEVIKFEKSWFTKEEAAKRLKVSPKEFDNHKQIVIDCLIKRNQPAVKDDKYSGYFINEFFNLFCQQPISPNDIVYN